MKLCAHTHCRKPIFDGRSDRRFCNDGCRWLAARAAEEEALDAKRPTRKTTPADIEIAYQRAIASQRSAS